MLKLLSPKTKAWMAQSSSSSDSVVLRVGDQDISAWKEVEVSVPPGPLGILLDGNFTTAAVLEAFAPIGTGNAKGVVELHGGVAPGSVLVGVNEYDFMGTKMSLAEIGGVLRESGHLTRLMRFKVPPFTAPVAIEASGVATAVENDKNKLLPGNATSSLVPEQEQSPPQNNVRRMSWKLAGFRTPPATTPTGSEKSGFVSMVSPTNGATRAATLPLQQAQDGATLVIEVPSGPMGLNLDSAVTSRAVVQGFVPLPDGSKGVLEQHGGVLPGSVLIRINNDDMSTASLEMVRSVLVAQSGVTRRLVFRLPPPNHQAVPSSTMIRASQTKVVEDADKAAARAALIRASRPMVVEDVDKRRQLELELILKHDKRKVTRREFWCLIDAEWMSQWTSFVARGGPMPGPISNGSLLEPGWEERMKLDAPGRPDVPRKGLQLKQHYRGVVPMVWCMFVALYGVDNAPILGR